MALTIEEVRKIAELARLGNVLAQSRTITTPPLGPSSRHFANAAALLQTSVEPGELMAALQVIEGAFGPRRGQPWSSRVLDLDIILWSGGIFADTHQSLVIPHPLMRQRSFVLQPAAQIAATWRDPLTGLTIGQLWARTRHPRPVPEKSYIAA